MVNNTNAMRRRRREKGFFVSFDYTDDALREIDRFFKTEQAVEIVRVLHGAMDLESIFREAPED